MFEKIIYLKLLAVGNVVDVGYRAHCERAAKELHVTGYADNLADASVEVVAECDPAVATEFIKRIRMEDHVKYLDVREVRLISKRKYRNFIGGGVTFGL